jgi:hypothetical protein
VCFLLLSASPFLLGSLRHKLFPVKDFKWRNAYWYDFARWGKFGLLWASVFLIIGGVVEMLCAIW